MDLLQQLWEGSGLYQMTFGQAAMIGIGLLLLYLGIAKKFEPLLLVTIGFGGVLSNIPGAEIATGDGLLHLAYVVGIETGAFPLIIFMGVGAMTDFGPLLGNPKTLFLGAAAQFGIFATLLGALGLTSLGWMDFSVREAAAIGIIGGADGPTAIYVAGQLAPELLGAIAVAAYSYMALVPLIQPPIIRALTNEKERAIEMRQLRNVTQTERILFPLLLLLLVALLLPSAAPLLGMFCFGNLMRECGVVDRLSDTTQNALINIVTIFLGLAVGSKLSAEQFLVPSTLGNSGTRHGGLCDWYRQRRADGEADEQAGQSASKPDHRRRRRVRRADGGARGEQGWPGSQPAEHFADARDGTERRGRDWLRGRRGHHDSVCGRLTSRSSFSSTITPCKGAHHSGSTLADTPEATPTNITQ